MNDICPSCHMSYAWDGHRCLHCQATSGVESIGMAAHTGSELLTLQQHLESIAGDSHITEGLSELIGDSLNSLGETFGEHLGELLEGFFQG